MQPFVTIIGGISTLCVFGPRQTQSSVGCRFSGGDFTKEPKNEQSLGVPVVQFDGRMAKFEFS